MPIKSINLKTDMPTVQEALQRLDRELSRARWEKVPIVKLIHGYGSSGAGGDIRIAVQKQLREMQTNGEIRACIFGEDWAKSDAATWQILQARRELRDDPDLGRRNQGMTVILL